MSDKPYKLTNPHVSLVLSLPKPISAAKNEDTLNDVAKIIIKNLFFAHMISFRESFSSNYRMELVPDTQRKPAEEQPDLDEGLLLYWDVTGKNYMSSTVTNTKKDTHFVYIKIGLPVPEWDQEIQLMSKVLKTFTQISEVLGVDISPVQLDFCID